MKKVRIQTSRGRLINVSIEKWIETVSKVLPQNIVYVMSNSVMKPEDYVNVSLRLIMLDDDLFTDSVDVADDYFNEKKREVLQ